MALPQIPEHRWGTRTRISTLFHRRTQVEVNLVPSVGQAMERLLEFHGKERRLFQQQKHIENKGRRKDSE